MREESLFRNQERGLYFRHGRAIHQDQEVQQYIRSGNGNRNDVRYCARPPFFSRSLREGTIGAHSTRALDDRAM